MLFTDWKNFRVSGFWQLQRLYLHYLTYTWTCKCNLFVVTETAYHFLDCFSIVNDINISWNFDWRIWCWKWQMYSFIYSIWLVFFLIANISTLTKQKTCQKVWIRHKKTQSIQCLEKFMRWVLYQHFWSKHELEMYKDVRFLYLTGNKNDTNRIPQE